MSKITTIKVKDLKTTRTIQAKELLEACLKTEKKIPKYQLLEMSERIKEHESMIEKMQKEVLDSKKYLQQICHHPRNHLEYRLWRTHTEYVCDSDPYMVIHEQIKCNLCGYETETIETKTYR